MITIRKELTMAELWLEMGNRAYNEADRLMDKHGEWRVGKAIAGVFGGRMPTMAEVEEAVLSGEVEDWLRENL